MFDLQDAAGVVQVANACHAAFSRHYIRLMAFDSTRGVASFQCAGCNRLIRTDSGEGPTSALPSRRALSHHGALVDSIFSRSAGDIATSDTCTL